jgi:hypothetical protein
MRRQLLHTLALLTAFALTACGADTQDDPQGGWCVDESECADASGGVDVGADVGADAGADAEPDTTPDAAPDADDEEDAADVERPDFVDPPVGLDFDDLATNGTTACGLAAGRVYCWGGNREGVAQPPEEELWADRVVMAPDYACAVGPLMNVVCWGDGAEAVSAADDAQLISRFTLYGASANADVVCQSSDYVPWTARITCYDDEGSWQVGPEGAVAVDVTYGAATASREATVCYAYTVEGGYAYRCEYGDTPIEVTESLGDWSGRFPTIRYDGVGEVAVLMSDGDVQWFDLNLDELDASPEDGIYRASRVPVDWGEWREPFDAARATPDNSARSDVQLLSTNFIFYQSYVVLMRVEGGSKVDMVARRSTRLAASHEAPVDMTYCFEDWYPDEEGAVRPECFTTRRQ